MEFYLLLSEIVKSFSKVLHIVQYCLPKKAIPSY